MVNSVLHATQILELYASQRKEYLSLTEISRALDLHKTTVYRILRTLQEVGWIEQSPTTSRYKLGTGMLLVASAVSIHLTTRDIITEEMRKLSQAVNETIVLSALRGTIGICVDMIKSRHSLSVVPDNGYIVPLDKGATGKTLLAAHSNEIIDKILAAHPLEEQLLLKKDIEEIRSKGGCISKGEVDQGVAAVAVPLPLSDSIYVLSISGPIDRIEAIGYDKLLEELTKAAKEIKLKDSMK